MLEHLTAMESDTDNQITCNTSACLMEFRSIVKELHAHELRIKTLEDSVGNLSARLLSFEVTMQYIKTQLDALGMKLDSKFDKLADSIASDKNKGQERIYGVIGSLITGVLLAIFLNFVMMNVEDNKQHSKNTVSGFPMVSLMS